MTREFRQNPHSRQGIFGFRAGQRRSKLREFPVISLFIKEIDPETCSYQTAPSTFQSLEFWTLRRIDRIQRVCARFAIGWDPESIALGGDSPKSANSSLGAIYLGPRIIAFHSKLDRRTDTAGGSNLQLRRRQSAPDAYGGGRNAGELRMGQCGKSAERRTGERDPHVRVRQRGPTIE